MSQLYCLLFAVCSYCWDFWLKYADSISQSTFMVGLDNRVLVLKIYLDAVVALADFRYRSRRDIQVIRIFSGIVLGFILMVRIQPSSFLLGLQIKHMCSALCGDASLCHLCFWATRFKGNFLKCVHTPGTGQKVSSCHTHPKPLQLHQSSHFFIQPLTKQILS